ncbi:MAG: phosphatase PAP2 family protein [Pseudomonadota bacterium]
MHQALMDLDRFLFLQINTGWRNPGLDWFMPLVSDWKFTWLPLALIMMYCLWRRTSRTLWVLAGMLLVIGLGDALTTYAIKPFFIRPRPYAVLEHIYVHKGQWGLSEAVAPHLTMSFPSNHAVNSTAAAVLLIYFFPRWWPLPVVWVILVCYSRIYLGLHYPADVLGGLLFGLVCAGVFLGLERILVKKMPGRFKRLGKGAAW